MANAEVKVAIVGDNSSLQSSLKQSQSGLASFGAAVGKLALAAGVAAAAGLAVIGKASVDAASLAQQSLGATETVFGKYADNVVKHSNRAAEALGLSANSYRDNANVIGALLGNQGVAADKLAGKTHSLIKTGADLAATFGGTTTDAVNALASAFKGEFDPLEQYGISIKQAAVNTEAYRVAGVETKKEFDALTTAQQNQAKQQATNNLLTKQAAKTQGAFAKETDTLAHQQQVLGAEWENLKVKIGNALLPAFTDLVSKINNDVMPTLQRFARKHLPAIRRALRDIFGGDPGADAAKLGAAFENVDWGSVGDSITQLADTVKELGPALAEIGVDTIGDGFSVLGEVVGFASEHLETLRKLLPIIAAGFLALKAAQVANSIAGRDSLIGLALQLAATRQLINANRELAVVIREVQISQGGATGALTAAGGAVDETTGKVSKLEKAAKGAAGIAGLGLLTAGAMTSNESLGALETTAGSVASGFAVGGPWGAAIGGAIGLVQSLVSANDGLTDSMDALDEAMRTNDVDALAASIEKTKTELDKATSATVYGSDAFGTFGGNVLNVVAPMTNLSRFMGGLTGDTEDTAAALAKGEEQLAAMRNGTYEASFAMGDFAYVIERNAEAAQEEADALRDATDAMREKRSEARRGLSAELDYEAAIDDANQSLKDNGKTVNKHTEAGRANLRSLYDLAGAWNDQSDAVKNSKGALAAARKNFIDTATAMGMSEGKAKALANRLLEIKPRTVKVQVEGTETATTKVKTLKDILAETKSKDIYVNLHYQTIGNKPKAPTPGGDTPRLSPKTLAEQKGDAYNDGLKVGEAFGKGANQGAGKAGKGKSLLETLFPGGVGKGLETIAAGIEAIGKRIEALVNRRIDNDKKADKAQARILDKLRAQTRALRENGKQQDANTAKLDDARAKVEAYAAAIKESFVSFGDITQLGQTSSGKTTLAKLLRDLGQRAADAREFNQLLQQLAAAGLDKTQIEQLTAAGPEAALATARAIASGGAFAIDEVNKLSRDIATSGGALGAALSDRFAIAGESSATSYITTLEREQARLDKTARHMAHALVDELQAQLAAVKPQHEHKDGKGKDGKGDTKPRLTDAALNGGKASTVTVKLTSQQVSSLERGREIQLDLDTYRAAGGRARA